MSLMLVGGINLSWEYLITGEALKQLAPLLAASAHGEVVVSPKCWAMVQDACEGAAIGSEMQVIAIRPKFLQPMPKIQPTNLPLVAEAAIRYECHCGSGSSSMINTSMNVGGVCDRSCSSIMRPAVQIRMDAHKPTWVDELRIATSLFVKITTPLSDDPEVHCAALHDLVSRMQRAIFSYEGMIIQFLEDDKVGFCERANDSSTSTILMLCVWTGNHLLWSIWCAAVFARR